MVPAWVEMGDLFVRLAREIERPDITWGEFLGDGEKRVTRFKMS